MCGILGSIPASNEEDFLQSLHTLSHRGPDDFGVFHSSDISLGHRRLSILDLSDNGKQPMHFGDSGLIVDSTNITGGGGATLPNILYSIVFNGEIYNFLEIRQTLISHGYIFHTHCDTEVILCAYKHYGEACLNHFNGMWALAIFDHSKKRLFLSRDRFGKKPLFYAFIKDANGGNKFIFASEMKAIYPYLSQIQPADDFYDLSTRRVYDYEGSQNCLIKGIQRFPFSHYAYYDVATNNLTLTRYYNILDHIKPYPSYKESIDIFRELFLDSVKLRMRSDVPIGTALSGGLDSSSTLCAMWLLAKHFNMGEDWQHAFIACFKDTMQDESEYAKAVVDYTGVKGEFLEINPLDNWHNIYKYFYLFEDMYITNPVPMIAIYGAVKKSGVSVTLDGHGADELFSGYGHLIWGALDNIYNPKLSFSFFTTDNDTKQFPLSPMELRKAYKRFILSQIKITIKNAIKFRKRRHGSLHNKHPNFKSMGYLNKNLFILFYETVLPTLLRNYDRYSMINSVEVRMPFLDHRLVEFVFSLPGHYKIGDGYTKKLMRDSFSDFLPKEIAWRKSKIGFSSPLTDWMCKSKAENGLKDWFLDIVNSKEFLECPLIKDPKRIKDNIVEIIKGRNIDFAQEHSLWCEFSPYLWSKSIKDYAIRF